MTRLENLRDRVCLLFGKHLFSNAIRLGFSVEDCISYNITYMEWVNQGLTSTITPCFKRLFDNYSSALGTLSRVCSKSSEHEKSIPMQQFMKAFNQDLKELLRDFEDLKVQEDIIIQCYSICYYNSYSKKVRVKESRIKKIQFVHCKQDNTYQGQIELDISGIRFKVDNYFAGQTYISAELFFTGYNYKEQFKIMYLPTSVKIQDGIASFFFSGNIQKLNNS